MIARDSSTRKTGARSKSVLVLLLKTSSLAGGNRDVQNVQKEQNLSSFFFSSLEVLELFFSASDGQTSVVGVRAVGTERWAPVRVWTSIGLTLLSTRPNSPGQVC